MNTFIKQNDFKIEQKLFNQNLLLEAIINSFSDGIVVFDKKYRILKVNTVAFDWLNNSNFPVLRHTLSEFIFQKKECIDFINLKNTKIIIKNLPNEIFEANTMPLQLKKNDSRLIMVIKNITTQTIIEKLKNNFVATLTHDLKVPIVAESNIVEFLLEGKFGEMNKQQTEALINIKKSNAELIELVQSILDAYKIKTKGIALEYKEFELNNFIEKIVQEFEPITNRQNLKIIFKKKNDIFLNADEFQTKRVVSNLIHNALSHSESVKDINIEIAEKDKNIEIFVIDYGKGISKEEIEKIFEEYYSSSKKLRKIGTGLGLYLAKQITKAHGGEILIESEENIKTVFCIKLPKFPIHKDASG